MYPQVTSEPGPPKGDLGADEAKTFKKLKTSQTARLNVVQEKDVGITQFISDESKYGGGFFGTLKQRYSDFLVNEIDVTGKVIHLTDEGVELGKSRREKKNERRERQRVLFQEKGEDGTQEIREQVNDENQKPKINLSPEHENELLKYLSQDELSQIQDLFNTGNNMTTKSVFPDKIVRASLHKLLREAFQGKLDTVTSPENTFRVALSTNAPKTLGFNRHDSINHRDENGILNYGLGPFKKFLHFTVYKENRETMEIASTISKFLRIPSKSIRYAGTKDRRGVTCQRFCIHKGKVARVSSINKGLRNAVLGGFSYEDYALGLGDLLGNEFIIAIRGVKLDKDDRNMEQVIDACFESLKTNGFINYFGMQRFGTFSISTHVLGIHILNERWQDAVELILSEQDIVTPDSVDARRVWSETKNALLALNKMPKRCSAECSVLSVLSKEPLMEDGSYAKNSYLKSIMSIPRNLRIMYAHAYQSYVWNMVASKRIELFGLNVVEGDLVIIGEEEKRLNAESAENDPEFEEDVKQDSYVRARPLTKEEILGGKYTVFDVVLPTPGFDVVYPSNEELKNVYINVMAKDGLDPDKMNRRIREFSLAGSYRHIVCKPSGLSYKIVNYKEDSDPLVRTDLEILRARKNENIELERVIASKDSLAINKAVILQMQLGVSSYATMALREFMKADTSRLSNNFNVAV